MKLLTFFLLFTLERTESDESIEFEGKEFVHWPEIGTCIKEKLQKLPEQDESVMFKNYQAWQFEHIDSDHIRIGDINLNGKIRIFYQLENEIPLLVLELQNFYHIDLSFVRKYKSINKITEFYRKFNDRDY